MAELTPQQEYDRGTKFKKAGIAVFIAGLIAMAVGAGLYKHGMDLQAHAMGRAQWTGTLIVTKDGKVLNPAPAAVPLGGGANGQGKAR